MEGVSQPDVAFVLSAWQGGGAGLFVTSLRPNGRWLAWPTLGEALARHLGQCTLEASLEAYLKVFEELWS